MMALDSNVEDLEVFCKRKAFLVMLADRPVKSRLHAHHRDYSV